MKILITNDDGIGSDGLLALARWAAGIGEVTVAAPKFEQSGRSHAINLLHPFEVKKTALLPGVDAYSVDSTPADCVRFALLGLGNTYDLVISGINNGYNLGTDIVYSGTVGAVFEASYFSVNSIAVSCMPGFSESAAVHLDKVYDLITEKRMFDHSKILNVNIPPNAAGIRLTRQGGPFYRDRFVSVGENMYRPEGFCVYVNHHDINVDADAVNDGYISITPLTVSRTDTSALVALKDISEDI